MDKRDADRLHDMLDPPELDDTSVAQYLAERGTHLLARQNVLASRQSAVFAAREQMFAKALGEAMASALRPGWLKAKPYRGRRAKYTERVVQVALGDWHMQSLLSPREVPVGYGCVEESRRIGKVAMEVADYKRQHRHETRLLVNVLGDMMQGILRSDGGAPLAHQMAALTRALIALIHFWASEYREVEVVCVPGNHGRDPSIHPERAIFQRWNALETAVYSNVALALQLSGHRNVTVRIPVTQYAITEFCGAKAFVVHGDTVFKVGNPGNSINTRSLYQQICTWNASRNIAGPFALFLAGHVHFHSYTEHPGGVSMLTNGPLTPPSHHAVSIGVPDVTCSQSMWESVPGYPVGDKRSINVDDADGRPEYDGIVPRFDGQLEAPKVSVLAPCRQVKDSIQARAAKKAAVTRTRDKSGRFAAEKRAV